MFKKPIPAVFALIAGLFIFVSASFAAGKDFLPANGYLLENGSPQSLDSVIAISPKVTINPQTGEVAGVSTSRELPIRAGVVVGTVLVVGAFVYFISGKPQGKGKLPNERKRIMTTITVVGILGVIGALLLFSQYNGKSPDTSQDPNSGADTTAKVDPTQESEVGKAEAEKKDEMADWKTYESYKYGYRISFPPNWIVNNLQKSTDFDFFVEPDKKVAVAVRVQNIEGLKDASSRQALLDKVIADRKSDTNYQITRSDKTLIGNNDGAIISGTTEDNGVSIQRNEILLTIASGRLYHIVVDIEKGTPDELVKVAQDVTNSFSIVSEANIAPKLPTVPTSFVTSGDCEIDLGAYERKATKPLDDSTKCGFGYTVDANVTLADLQSWYMKNAASLGWQVISISPTRLVSKSGSNSDFFTMVRCASQGEFDQEVLIILEDGQVTVDLRGVKTNESACVIDKQLIRLEKIRDDFIQAGFKQAFDLSEKSQFENLVIAYQNGWKDRSFLSDDKQKFLWASGDKNSSGRVVENEDKSQTLYAFVVDEENAAADFSADKIKQSLKEIPNVQNIEAGYGAFSDIRGVWLAYDIDESHYFGTAAIIDSRPVLLVASTPKESFAGGRFLLLEMIRSIARKK
ncbi:MAG: hypothetical protein Q8P25_04145 [Candidatus Curtissbacteria bacterium]|nr:hypothetical protein [Candidatus Curtissbacteria bacterium]